MRLVQNIQWTELILDKWGTVAQKEKVRTKQKGKCAICHKPPPRWEYDHKDEDRSNNSPSNCQ